MASEPSDLRALAFSTAELPAADRFEAWREHIAPLFALELLEKHSRPVCAAAAMAFHLGTVLVSRVDLASTSHRGLRPAQKVRRDPLDHYLVEVCSRGGCRGEAGAGDFALGVGDVGFFDLGQPFTMQSSLSDSTALVMPRALIDALVPEAAGLHGTVLRGGMAGMLRAHVRALYRHIPALSADEAGSVAQATVAMVAACLAPSPDSLRRAQRPLESVLVQRARQYIARNLDSPDLSVQRICASLRVSRSHLYRAFEADGGIAAYVQACRLARAHAALRDPKDRRLVAEIAYDHGFSSAANFSRVFRRQFGVAPGDVRAGARSDAMPSGGVGDWLRSLGAEGG